MMRRCRRNQLDPFLQTVHVTSKVTFCTFFLLDAFDVNVVLLKNRSLSGVRFVLAGNS